MAKVTGPITISGTIGSITFKKTKHGNIAGSKSSLSKDRVKNSDEFANSRKASEAFGNAGKAYGQMRAAMPVIFGKFSTVELSGMMSKFFIRRMVFINEDRERKYLDLKRLSDLKNLNLNSKSPLNDILRTSFTCTKHSGTEYNFHFDSSFLTMAVSGIEGASHYKLHFALAAIDFSPEGRSYQDDYAITDWMPIKDPVKSDLILELDEEWKTPVFGAVAVELGKYDALDIYPLNAIKKQTAGIIMADCSNCDPEFV